MTATTTPLTVSVEDRLAIHELTYRYAYHIDRYELDPLLELWTEDAIFDERPLGLFYAEGIDQIRAFFEHDYKVSSAHVHYMTNHIIDAVSETEARGTCCGLVQADLHSGAVVHATVYYTDDYVKRDGKWLFKSRVVRPFCKMDLSNISAALDEQIGTDAPLTGGAPTLVGRVNHVGLSVRDIERSIAFYCGVLGMQLRSEHEILVSEREILRRRDLLEKVVGMTGIAGRVAQVDAGNAIIELWQYDAPQGRELDPDHVPADVGIAHLALQVHDVDAVWRKVIGEGYSAVSEPVDLEIHKTFYMRGPDGEILEILEDRWRPLTAD